MGRVGIVTGAASGIGQALATALVERGDTVVLADVNAGGAKQVAAGLGSRASAVGLDVRDPTRSLGSTTTSSASTAGWTSCPTTRESASVGGRSTS